MFENPYTEKVEQLIRGEISEIKVNREEMMLFREVWIQHPDRKSIVGAAALGGNITYSYQKEET